MKRAIYKFKLPYPFDGEVPIQQGAEVLSAAFVAGDLYIWALVEPAAGMVKERFLVLPDNKVIDAPAELPLQLLGRVSLSDRIVMAGQPAAFHVFHIPKVQ